VGLATEQALATAEAAAAIARLLITRPAMVAAVTLLVVVIPAGVAAGAIPMAEAEAIRAAGEAVIPAATTRGHISRVVTS
jgi:hypothetical protein